LPLLWEETMINLLKKLCWSALGLVAIVALIKLVSDVQDMTETEERVKPKELEVITHDTIEVTKYVHDTVYRSLDGTGVVVQKDTVLYTINTPDEFKDKKLLVGFPKMESKNNGMVILHGHGPTFEDVEYFTVGCEGTIYTVDSKPGLQWCTGHWVVRIKETAPAPSLKPAKQTEEKVSISKTLFDGVI